MIAATTDPASTKASATIAVIGDVNTSTAISGRARTNAARRSKSSPSTNPSASSATIEPTTTQKTRMIAASQKLTTARIASATIRRRFFLIAASCRTIAWGG
ncbi:MAG: hypothetical protein ACT4PI_12670 [Actinomycetota bacterium]